MKSGLRAGVLVTALIAASCTVVTAQWAAASEPVTVAKQPPSEVTAADTQTTLPTGTVADVLVDDTHAQVLVSMPSNNSVVVADFDGKIAKTVTGLSAPSEMSANRDGSVVYVVERNSATIASIDSESHEVDHLALPDGICPVSLTFTGGKLWFSYLSCTDSAIGGNGVLDPGSGGVTTGLLTAKSGIIRALPDRPDRLFLLNDEHLGVYDVSGATPVTVAEETAEGAIRNGCKDAALVSGGDRVVTACQTPADEHEVFLTADLSSATSIHSWGSPNAVAVSADGRFVATGAAGTETEINVTNVESGTPGTRIRYYDISEHYWRLRDNALAFSDSGQLFAVDQMHSGDGGAKLHVLSDATKFRTNLALKAPKAIANQSTVSGTGSLSYAPGFPTTATLTRADRAGTHDLGTVEVSAEGRFVFSDTPDVTGPATYTIRHAGDEQYAPSEGSATTIMRPRPYDINADGFADTVLGVPGEDIGSVRNAGQFHVLYGTASGTTSSGSQSFNQDTAGVPGTAEAGDQFGFTNAIGDFNGDGYADVAIAANMEDLVFAVDAGLILVFYGSAHGLRTDKVTSLYVDLTDQAVGNTAASTGLFLGNSLAAGDFDGDGRDDLAAGGPWAGSGHVFVFQGYRGAISRGHLNYEQGSNFVPGEPGESDGFGWSLSAGDANGDGNADLAIGAVYDWEDRDWSTGSATVLYGTTWGLNGNHDGQRFSKDSAGVPGGSGSFNPDAGDSSDQFGHQIALADYTGDGRADLAVGAPGSPVTVDGVRKRDAGTVTVLYSSGTQITTTGAVQVSQQTSGMPGGAGQEDYLGTTLAAGDTDGDDRAELAIYSPGDTYVTVVPGASGKLSFAGAKGWTQNSSGIPGSSEAGDWWGNSLRFADVKGTGAAALIVGADGENSGQGACTVIYSTNSGLTGTGATYFSQNTTGVAGTPENWDGFGVFY